MAQAIITKRGGGSSGVVVTNNAVAGSNDTTATASFEGSKVLTVCGCQSVWENTGTGKLQIQVNNAWVDCTSANGYLVAKNNSFGELRTGTRLIQWINNGQYKDILITGARYTNSWADGSCGVIVTFTE